MSVPSPRTSQADLVRRARALADELSLRSEHAVGRGIFRALLADFEANSDQDVLHRMVELLLKGSGGHLERTGGYGEQAETAANAILAELRSGDLSPGEYRTLFAWTARLLPTKPRKASPKTGPRQEGTRRPPRRTPTPAPAPPPKVVSPSRLSPFDEKSRAALESLLPKSGEPDGGGKGK